MVEGHELSHVLGVLLLLLNLELLPLCYGVKMSEDPAIIHMELVISFPIVCIFHPLCLGQLRNPLRHIL